MVSLAVYVVSFPWNEDKNPPKNYTSGDLLPSGLPPIQPEANAEHKLQKRLDATASSYALAEKEQKEPPKNKDDENRHFEKRDTKPQKSDQKSPTENSRKTRDTSEHGNKSNNNTKKDQHRIARDTQPKDEKPKREVPQTNPHDSKPDQQPPKSNPVHKRDIAKESSTHDPVKHTGLADDGYGNDDDDEHTRLTRSQHGDTTNDKVPENQQNPKSKREAKDSDNGNDSKPKKDTKKP